MKKVMICADLSNDSLDLLKKRLADRTWEDVSEVHIIHGFQLQVYADTFYFASYPAEDQYADIEGSVMTVLENFQKELLKDKKAPKVVTKCLIANSPKDVLADYAKEQSVDEMIIGTRGIHGIAGLFSSSFAEHMVRHAPCELRILRQ